VSRGSLGSVITLMKYIFKSFNSISYNLFMRNSLSIIFYIKNKFRNCIEHIESELRLKLWSIEFDVQKLMSEMQHRLLKITRHFSNTRTRKKGLQNSNIIHNNILQRFQSFETTDVFKFRCIDASNIDIQNILPISIFQTRHNNIKIIVLLI